MTEYVTLVDSSDREVGRAEKLTAHRAPLLHRAFSIFLFDASGRVLLQKRARGKYHSPGLWSNSCCGHPRPGEDLISAGARRLDEELGLHSTLIPVGHFIYDVQLPGGLYEHELDHLLIGLGAQPDNFNRQEVEAVRWARVEEITEGLKTRPELFTAWFPLAWSALTEHACAVAG